MASITWERLERWLPSDFESLRHAAGARNSKNMKVLLSAILSSVQVLQTALSIADGAAATRNEETGAWEWTQHFVNESFAKRMELFAWHCVAVRAEELEHRWKVDKSKALSIALQFRNRLGFLLVHQGVEHPDIDLRVPDRAASGGAKIFTRVELQQFQRRAVLAVPAAIELHRALTGAVAGRVSGDGQWLRCENHGNCGACEVYELPDWEGAEPCLIYLREEKVIGLHNPRGFKHEKPKKAQP
eukprot:3933204-Rhodomonas_salina.1